MLAGALLGGLLALASTLLTTQNARRVLEATLQEERTRLDRQIEAAREQLVVQLTHERSLRDHAELRELLDAAVSAIYDVADSYGPMIVNAYHVATEDPQGNIEAFKHSHSTFQTKSGALSRFLPRIELRIGDTGPIARALAQVRTSWEDGLNELERWPRLTTNEERIAAFERMKEADQRSRELVREFTTEAHRIVASRPFEDSSGHPV